MAAAPFDPADLDLLRSLRELAEQAARAGGAVARQAFGGRHHMRRKSDGSEVTDADEAAQTAILARLRAQRPHDAVIAEEEERKGRTGRTHAARRGRGLRAAEVPAPSSDRVCWVVDPIDGTRNFIRGIPLYAVSVAAMFAGVPVVGAVYVPDRDEIYSAGGSAGLLINGKPARLPAHVLEGATDRSSRLLVGIPSSLQGAAYRVMQHWSPRVVVRNLGVTALHLAMVAAGQFRAALISDSKLWDIAAGWLLIQTAGGVMTTLDGRDVFPLDVVRYGGEAIPSLASCDAKTHRRLFPVGAAK